MYKQPKKLIKDRLFPSLSKIQIHSYCPIYTLWHLETDGFGLWVCETQAQNSCLKKDVHMTEEVNVYDTLRKKLVYQRWKYQFSIF